VEKELRDRKIQAHRESQVTLVSIVPNLLGGEGHVLDYHKSVGQAADLLNWKHSVACVPDFHFHHYPPFWHPCLQGGNLEAEGNGWQKLGRIGSVFRLGRSIFRYLKEKVLPQSDRVILFVERFIHLQLLAIFLSLLFLPRQKLTVWLLYRRDIHRSKTRWIYQVLNHAIARLLPPGGLVLLTDSERLRDVLSPYFQKTVRVLPIPHTEILHGDRFPRSTSEIFCWWSGPPREEKGWEIVKSLVETPCKECENICILAAKSSQLRTVAGGVKLQFVENNLIREDYIKWMNTCDIILIPYDSKAYRERTSGIFTECIIAGKIPLVTPDTWMAQELFKYDLQALVLNWEKPREVFGAIAEISKSPEIQSKLTQMQRSYSEFHSLSNYTQNFKSLFAGSFDDFKNSD
jgi:glycosyltransferase involved in cell wall biosynthesis